MIVVTDEYSWVELKPGAQSTRFENKVAWQESATKKLIIAVGGPGQWAAPGPLPPGAVVTNLVPAATLDPELARSFWGPFLAYIFYSAKPPWWRRDPLLGALGLFKQGVLLQLCDSSTEAAVRSAIETSPFSRRFFVHKETIP
jgi:hypothetical protein